MKKLNLKAIAVAMAAALTLGLAGCSSNGNSSTADSSATAGDSTSVTESKAEGDNSLQKVKDAGQFILGLDATFKPMGYTDENGEIVGFDIDVAKEVCNRLGVKLVKQPINWDTLTTDLNVGKCDCVWNGLSINEERQEKMNLSEPYMKNAMVFVVKGDSTVAKMDDLKGKKITIQEASTAETALNRDPQLKAAFAEVKAYPDLTACFMDLESGRCDAVLSDTVLNEYYMTKKPDTFRELPDQVSKDTFAIGIKKDNQALVDLLNQGIDKVIASGEAAKISEKWFGKDVVLK